MVVLELLFRVLDFTVSSIKDITREGGIAAVATMVVNAETVRVEERRPLLELLTRTATRSM
jgi:hypothetical protein